VKEKERVARWKQLDCILDPRFPRTLDIASCTSDNVRIMTGDLAMRYTGVRATVAAAAPVEQQG
jgi:hypothetical protein